MANTKISQLPAATTLTTADLLPVVQGGVTKQVTPDLLPLSTAAASALAGKDAAGAAAAAQTAAISAAATAAASASKSADTITDGTTNKAYTATERTKLAGIATAATANATDAQLRDRTTHTGTQTSDTVSDFAEAAQDAAAAMFRAGTNVTFTYDDAAGTFTINASGGGAGTTDPEVVRDTIGGALVGGANIQITVNDAADTITIAVTGLATVATTGSYTDLTNKPTIPAPTSNATTSTPGLVQLAGDLAGTATAPTVPGLASKAPLASPAFTGTPTIAGSPLPKTTPAGRFDATSAANGTVTALTTGQAIANFGAAPATVTSGVIVNTPTGSSPTAAYLQADLGAKIGRIGADFELNGTEIVTLVVPVATWTDGAGNLITLTNAAAHFGINQTSWSYGVWVAGAGQTVLATGALNLTNGVTYGVDLYFDSSTSSAYATFSDGTFATITDPRINTYRSTLAIWELYSNTSSDTGAKFHVLRADVETGAASINGIDVSRVRSQIASAGAATATVTDEFMGGTTSTGTVGDLGWTLIGGTVTKINAEAGHPGIVDLTTGAVSGTLAALWLDNSVLGSELWDLTFWLRLNNVDSSTKIRIGWSSDPTADAPTVAAYFEKLAADTHWWAAPRVANLAGPRSDTGVTAATGWHKFRIRQPQALNFLFSIDGGTEIDVTQYLAGSSERIKPVVQITNSAAAAKTVDLDAMRLVVSNLTR